MIGLYGRSEVLIEILPHIYNIEVRIMKIKEIFCKMRKKPQTGNSELRREYNMLLSKLSDIRSNFNFTDNPSTIDALIYEENAALCRLRELYSEARKNGMTLEAFELDQK